MIKCERCGANLFENQSTIEMSNVVVNRDSDGNILKYYAYCKNTCDPGDGYSIEISEYTDLVTLTKHLMEIMNMLNSGLKFKDEYSFKVFKELYLYSMLKFTNVDNSTQKEVMKFVDFEESY